MSIYHAYTAKNRVSALRFMVEDSSLITFKETTSKVEKQIKKAIFSHFKGTVLKKTGMLDSSFSGV